MATLHITAREFRAQQADFLNQADKGVNVVIKRGSERCYALVPVENDDFLTPEMKKRIAKSLQEIKKGLGTKVSTKEELVKFLDSL